jgi:uncharacterized phage protein (TIGR01671 family)
MSRIIKFRTWIESEKYMAYQGESDLETLQSFIFHYGDEKLMQFTGLKDIYGKEIYEGDIVSFKRSVGNWTGKFITTIHEVVFTDVINAYVLKNGNHYIKLRKHDRYEYKILGNIYETHE